MSNWDPYSERIKLKQKQDNLNKAEALVHTFPNHESIRLAIHAGLEIKIDLVGLSSTQKIEKIYNAYNNYITK